MREIKFRGRTKSGSWIHGFVVLEDLGTYIDTGHGVRIEIEPDTIGQFTGLLDRHGKEIYEGDIAKITQEAKDSGGLPYTELGVMTWIEKEAKFAFDVRDGFFVKGVFRMTIEIIGNIYEHPKLTPTRTAG